MQDTNDLNPIRDDPKIERMSFKAIVAVSRAYLVAGWRNPWLLRQLLERFRQNVYIAVSLFYALRLSAVNPNVFKTTLCRRCKTVFSHMSLTFFS